MTDTINESLISELKELMAEDFPVLIETYITDSDERISSLQTALAQADSQSVRELAHAFKGSSSNLGADALAKICFQLETMGRNAELNGSDEVYDALTNEYQQVKRYFNSLI